MKSRFSIKQKLSTVALVATMAAGISASVYAAEETIPSTADKELTLESLAGRYSQRITELDLEIRNETERRTDILEQLDNTMNELSELEKESDFAVQNSPKLNSNVEQINRDIEVVDRDIRLNDRLLAQVNNSLQNQPRPTVWQAALGKPEIKARQKLVATQRYLVHTIEQKQLQLQAERARLREQYQTIVEYSQGISESIDELHSDASKTLEDRTQLEQELADISSEIVSRQDRISALQQRLQRLESNPATTHFASMRKQLPDPVEGTLIRKFSEPKAKGLLKWKGILIEAPLGLPFSAVSDGVVVFADQLQGLGNVVIVDHGQGYMSLYGMAELLLVQKDQLLLAGDTVGTVGEYVGAETSALYFEVRHNADAVDPQDWLAMNQITQKNNQ